MAAATAAVDALGPAEELEGIVPYVNHRSSQLKGRSIAVNPAQGAWQAAAKLALRAELLLAAVVDKHKFAPYVMSGAAGLLLGTVSYAEIAAAAVRVAVLLAQQQPCRGMCHTRHALRSMCAAHCLNGLF